MDVETSAAKTARVLAPGKSLFAASAGAHDNVPRAGDQPWQPQVWDPEFKPREARSMSFKDKISRWLDNLPWIQVENGYWVLDCYPAVPSVLTSSGGFLNCSDEQDLFEKQAREITRMITEKYINNGEVPARPMTFGHLTEHKSLEIEYVSDHDRSF